MELNHRTLCEIGAKFLQRPHSANGHGCQIAFIECAVFQENPDVIGFSSGMHKQYGDNPCSYNYSVLLEAKMSRSDFLADRKKPHRQNGYGMGKYRYYICPENLIKAEELPEKWGLIYVNARGHCKVICGAVSKIWGDRIEREKLYAHESRDVINENNLLVMMLNRIECIGDVYQMQRQFAKINEKMAELELENHRLRNDAKREPYMRGVVT